MALLQIHFFSEELTECSSIHVILPVERWKKEKYPVLWLLPPAGRDHTAWQRNTTVEQLADELGIMAVMPDLKLSFGTDMAHGFRYFTMLTKELPELIEEYFPADLENQMIAGAKEGAYAALRAAFLCPGRYKLAAGFSCGSLTDEAFTEKKKKCLLNAFGSGEPSGDEYSLRALAKRRSEGQMKVYFAYGDQDEYRKSAKQFAETVGGWDGYEAVCFHGALGWTDWERLLREQI